LASPFAWNSGARSGACRMGRRYSGLHVSGTLATPHGGTALVSVLRTPQLFRREPHAPPAAADQREPARGPGGTGAVPAPRCALVHGQRPERGAPARPLCGFRGPVPPTRDHPAVQQDHGCSGGTRGALGSVMPWSWSPSAAADQGASGPGWRHLRVWGIRRRTAGSRERHAGSRGAQACTAWRSVPAALAPMGCPAHWPLCLTHSRPTGDGRYWLTSPAAG
jgi:hypothetical protein